MAKLNQKQIKDIATLKIKGFTTSQIAKKYSLHVSSVRYWYDRLAIAGVKLPASYIGRPRLDLSQMVKDGEAKRQAEAESL